MFNKDFLGGPQKSETKFYGASARQRASTCKTTTKKDVFSIESFHRNTIRIFEVVVRANGRSLFMFLTTYVLGGPPKSEPKFYRASACKTTSKKDVFSIEPFHLITIRQFEMVVRAIGGSLFMALTTYVLHLNVKFRKGNSAGIFSSIKDISGSIGAVKKS